MADDDESLGTELASKLAGGLASKIGAELGGLIVNMFVTQVFGAEGPPSYFKEVFAEIRNIVSDEIQKEKIIEMEVSLRTCIQWMSFHYKDSTDEGHPDIDGLKKHNDDLEGVVNGLKSGVFEQRGFSIFLTAAAVHLSYLLELAKKVPSSGYDLDVTRYAQMYIDHITAIWPPRVAARRAAIYLSHEGEPGSVSNKWLLHDDIEPTRDFWTNTIAKTAEDEAKLALSERIIDKVDELAASLGFPDGIAVDFASLAQNPFNPERHLARPRPARTDVTQVNTDGFLLSTFGVRMPYLAGERQTTNRWAVVFTSGKPLSGMTLSYDVKLDNYYDYGSFFCPIVKGDTYGISMDKLSGDYATNPYESTRVIRKWQPFEGLGLGGWNAIERDQWHHAEQDGFAVVYVSAVGGSHKATATILGQQRANQDSGTDTYVITQMQHGSPPEWANGSFIQMWAQSFCMPVSKGYDFRLYVPPEEPYFDVQILNMFWVPVNGPYQFKAPASVAPLTQDPQQAANDGILFGCITARGDRARGHCFLLAGDSPYDMFYNPSLYATTSVYNLSGRLIHNNSAAIVVRKGQFYCAQIKEDVGPLSGIFHFTEIEPT